MISEGLEIGLTLLSVGSSIVNTFAAILMYIAAKRQNDKSERAYAPYLYPEETWYCKEKWIRYYKGIDVPDYIVSKKYSELTLEEKVYFDNCSKYENSHKIYFDRLGNQDILVANLNEKMPTTLIEHGNTEVTFVNYGEATMTRLKVKKVEIYKLNGEIYDLDGVENNSLTCCIPAGGKKTIIFDMVSDNIEISTCNISKIQFDEMRSVNIFSQEAEALQYCEKIVFYITLENIYNTKYDYTITIKKDGNRLERVVERI